ncbi:ABC transporter permease [Candidatus Pacearchaeota archaeon]|nr:ABC transporter permease [Candidatus Pacearchaeota archaeon]
MVETLKLAMSNLRHRGVRSWLTLLGIIIGITAVIALLSLGQGLQNAITGQFSGIAADRLILTNAEAGFGPPGSTAVRKLTEHDQNVVDGISGVKSTIPRLIRVTSVDYNRQRKFIFTGSLPDRQEGIDFFYTSFQIKTKEGKLLKSSDKGEILLGSELAKERQFGKDIHAGTKLTIQGREFSVAGILAPSGNMQFNNAMLMPEEDMRNILELSDEMDILIIRIDDIERSDEIKESIENKLRKDRNLKKGEEDFSIQTPAGVISSVNTILTVINIVVAGIAAIALLIGSIGVSNTMFTSVLERKKEIGTMKAVGAKNSDILFIFLIESGMLGFIGGSIGVVMGIGFAYAAAAGANSALGTNLLQASFSLPLIGGAVLFTFLLGIIAGSIPAWKASRMHPVEALRS